MFSSVCNYANLILAAVQNSQSAAETDCLTEGHNQNICELELANVYLNLSKNRPLTCAVDRSRGTVTQFLFKSPDVMLFYFFLTE